MKYFIMLAVPMQLFAMMEDDSNGLMRSIYSSNINARQNVAMCNSVATSNTYHANRMNSVEDMLKSNMHLDKHAGHGEVKFTTRPKNIHEKLQESCSMM